MSLEKGIKYGKEHRKKYYGAKAFSKSCRNHGSDPWTKGNRKHKFIAHEPLTRDKITKEFMNDQWPEKNK